MSLKSIENPPQTQDTENKMMSKFSYVLRSSLSSGGSVSHTASKTFPILGIIFDLDGTLTLPVLDFKVLRKRLECPHPHDILEFVQSKPTTEKTRLLKMIEDFEHEGNSNMTLQPGLHSLLRFVSDNGLKKAVVTRNAKPCVNVFLEKLGKPEEYGGSFSHLLTRDFTPSKPDPAPIRHICKEWELDPSNVIMVGDHLHDMMCGKDAGSVTILLNNAKNTAYKTIADFNVDSLDDMVALLKNNSMVIERRTDT